MSPSPDPLDRFLVAWRERARRPPATPPEVAARRLVAQLPERRRSPAIGMARPPGAAPAVRRALAAAAVVALAVAAAWTVARLPSPEAAITETPAGGGDLELPPLDRGVVLLWLDHRTPLYLTVEPPAPEASGPVSKGEPS